jgi:outer membrane protein OmpA-like peptidoglycan-associated protein
MTKSPIPSISATSTLQPSEPRPKTFAWGRATATLIFRLVLLGAGASVATATGIAFAQLYPSQAEQIPLAEQLFQRPEALWQQIQQLPSRWNSSSVPSETSSSAPASNPSLVQPVPSVAALLDSERQQLQTELTQLQAELQTLTSQSTEPLADRVQDLQKRIQSIQTKLSSFTTIEPAQPVVAVPTQSDQLTMTLPSDALFEAGAATLRPGAEAILSSLLTDLQRYPEASILVGAHTNPQGTAEADRQQSLEQAKAVQQFLASRVESNLNWMPIGYGHTRPLAADDSAANQQRNRRIEIVIQPQ